MRVSLPDSAYRLTIGAMGIAADLFSIRKPLILCFHSVVPAERPDIFASDMSITDRFLGALIEHLRRRRIPMLSLASALDRLREDRPGPFVCFTFDDGYRDNYEWAFPVFKKHDVPFTIFLATGLVDRNAPMWWHALEKALSASDRFVGPDQETPTTISTRRERQAAFDRMRDRFLAGSNTDNRHLLETLATRNETVSCDDAYGSALTWDMVREMAASGIVEFGCHTMTHPQLSRLTPSEIAAEIGGSRDRLRAETGLAASFFAYPFGQPHEVGVHAPGIAEASGFSAAFTTEARILSGRSLARPYGLPRVLLSRKAQNCSVVTGYMSGMPATLKRLARR